MSVPPQPGSEPALTVATRSNAAGDAIELWGWSLLALFLVLITGITVLAVARRFMLGRVGSRAARRQRRTSNASAWEEAGRRMPTPDSELKEEP